MNKNNPRRQRPNIEYDLRLKNNFFFHVEQDNKAKGIITEPWMGAHVMQLY